MGLQDALKGRAAVKQGSDLTRFRLGISVFRLLDFKGLRLRIEWVGPHLDLVHPLSACVVEDLLRHSRNTLTNVLRRRAGVLNVIHSENA